MTSPLRLALLLATSMATACAQAGHPPAPGDGDGVDAGTGDADRPEPDGSEPTCGNGATEAGETCDPPGTCPSSCDDFDECTIDTLTGAAATCTAACGYADVAFCAAGDGCCALGCSMATDADCPPFTVDDAFDDEYRVFDLGPAPGVPPLYGCIMVDPADPDRLLLGGSANTAAGMLYAVPVTRNPLGHITGFAGTATVVASAEYNDGGIATAPGGVTFLARWPVNGFGQLRSDGTTLVTDLTLLGVASSPGGLMIVPTGHPGAGSLKLVSWPGGAWYDVSYAPDGAGTYALTAAAQRTTITGGPEGIVYAPIGSPLIPMPSVIVSEYSAGEVSIYEVDAAGDPIPATRRRFLAGLSGAEGAHIDPVTGDFLFSTFGGGDRVVVVRGFVPPIP
jgi:hypothetical protein